MRLGALRSIGPAKLSAARFDSVAEGGVRDTEATRHDAVGRPRCFFGRHGQAWIDAWPCAAVENCFLPAVGREVKLTGRCGRRYAMVDPFGGMGNHRRSRLEHLPSWNWFSRACGREHPPAAMERYACGHSAHGASLARPVSGSFAAGDAVTDRRQHYCHPLAIRSLWVDLLNLFAPDKPGVHPHIQSKICDDATTARTAEGMRRFHVPRKVGEARRVIGGWRERQGCDGGGLEQG